MKKQTRRQFLKCSAAAGAALCIPSLLTGCQGSGPADVILENGIIHLDTGRITNSLAIRGGVVIATGKTAQETVDWTTKRIDLASLVATGKTAHAFPGFHDSHMHLLDGAFLAGRLQLVKDGGPIASQADLRSAVKDYIDKLNDPTGTAWVVGMGWRFDNPSGVNLDDITGKHPLFLVDLSGHSALVNTLGLQAAKVDDTTPDPQGGKVVRDNNKRLTGWLKEAAMGLVAPIMANTFTDAELGALLPLVLTQTARLGLTGVSEMLGSPGMSLPRPWIFTGLEKEGKLPLRIHYAVPIFAIKDIEQSVMPLWKDPRYNTELVRCIAGKVWVDGAMGNASSWASPSFYLPGQQSSDLGIHYFLQGELDAIVALAEGYGLPLHFHVNGDLAIDSTLQALEKTASRQGGLKSRHTLIHLGFVTPEARLRMKTLGVTCAIQPGFWSLGFSDVAKGVYTQTAMDQAYDFGALLDSGVAMSVGTDWPVVPTKNPMDVMKSGLLGANMGKGTGRPLTQAEVIAGYTLGSGIGVGRRDLGRLDPGFAADVTVFDDNLLSLADFSGIKTVATMVAGRLQQW